MPVRQCAESNGSARLRGPITTERAKGGRAKEYLLEFVRQGAYVRIAAIDPETATEVVTVGAANRGKEELSRLAVRKLEYVLAKQKRQDG